MSQVEFAFGGHRALVTGGTQGIGRAIAEMFATAGASVAVCARTGSDAALTAESLDALGTGTCVGLAADLAEPAMPERLFDEVTKQLGGLDILVNNAAAQGRFPLPGMTSETWHWMMQVNMHAPYELGRCFAEALMERGASGSIVNIVTDQVIRHAKGRVGYGSTKLGLVGLTRTFAVELADKGIRVNAIAPAHVEVPRIYTQFTDTAERVASMPVGRFLQPEEVARAVLFLASDAASAITGVVLPVDGAHSIEGSWVND